MDTLGEVELAGVVRSRPAPGAPTLEEVLRDPTVDAVCICSPNLVHAELARRVIEARKHVLVEYPLAASPEEAKTLFDAARERDLVLHVEHIELLSPSQAAQREGLKALGDLVDGALRFRSAGEGWILDASLAGTPALRALARLHRLVDLFGEAFVQRAELEDRDEEGYRLEVRLVFKEGGRATLIEERGVNAAREVEWDLVCKGGRLGNPPAAPRSGLFARDLEHFVRRVREGIPSYVPESRILHVLELVRDIDGWTAAGVSS
jgi:biliverdin reductase